MSMFSFHKKPSVSQWLLLSLAIFALHFVVGLLVVSAINGKMPNHGLTPIFQYFGVFKLIWPEQPLGSLHFMATKSIFVFSHYDTRSALNLWTLEYDFYTLFVYLAISLGLGRIVAGYWNDKSTINPKQIALFFTCGAMISFSISYMTVLEHCSGATWVGFVSLYGIGINEFDLYPIYQIIFAIIGILGFIGTFIWLNMNNNRGFS